MTLKNEELQELETLYKEVYDTEYFFDPNDISPILKLSRESAPVESLRNVTKRFIKSFTVPIPEHGVHYDGSFVYAIAGAGKTTFIWQLIYRIWQKYGEDLNPIVNYGPMSEGTRYFNDKKVQLLICDDALSHHSKNEKQKEATELLAKIRHEFDNYDDTINGIVFIIFVSQSIYDLDKGVRRQLNKRVYKSLSGLKWDNVNSIKPDIGSQAFNVLSKIHEEIFEKANNDFKVYSIVSFVGGINKNNSGYIHFDYNLEEIAKAKEIATIIMPNNEQLAEKYVNFTINETIEGEFFDDLPRIFIDELKNNRELLLKARAIIGDDVLERNIKFWYLRHFHGWDYNDLAELTGKVKDKNTPRIAAGNVRKFLKDNNAFKATISERFFLEKFQNSTVSPPPPTTDRSFSCQQKKSRWFLPQISNQHPDYYLLLNDDQLVAVMGAKMHFERETYNPSPERQYAKHYSIPCYMIILDIRKKEALMRFGKINPEEEEELKMDTVEIMGSWEQVLEILRRDLLGEENNSYK